MDDDRVLTLVLVEDDRIEGEALRRGVKRRGLNWNIFQFFDGIEALEHLRGEAEPEVEHPFAVLLDLNMPRMNGIEFLTELRSDPGLAQTPVVVLTSSDHPRDLRDVDALGVHDYLTKNQAGLDYSRALGAIRRAIENRN